MKNMKRAIRRHHRQRMLKKRRNQLRNTWGYNDDRIRNNEWVEQTARQMLHTPCLCSCFACCNPRHSKFLSYTESLTLQERRNLISFTEQMGSEYDED